MSRSHTSSPPYASMMFSGTALYLRYRVNYGDKNTPLLIFFREPPMVSRTIDWEPLVSSLGSVMRARRL
jgi:hypothetical protein